MSTQFFPRTVCRHNLFHDINPGCPPDIYERQVPAVLLKCPSCKHSELPCYPPTKLAPAAAHQVSTSRKLVEVGHGLHPLVRPRHGRKGDSGAVSQESRRISSISDKMLGSVSF